MKCNVVAVGDGHDGQECHDANERDERHGEEDLFCDGRLVVLKRRHCHEDFLKKVEHRQSERRVAD